MARIGKRRLASGYHWLKETSHDCPANSISQSISLIGTSAPSSSVEQTHYHHLSMCLTWDAARREVMSAQRPLAETPPKGCPRCQNRRIECDRGLPGCRKCAKRGLECPGYGTKLKWVQGVASRGKLQGKSVPSRNAATAGFDAQAVQNVHGNQGSSSSTNQSTLQPTFLTPLSNPCLLDSQTPYVSQLLPYFNERVARRLAWVDGPENPWRHMVLPLIDSSETVLSSVLALTAHDLASQYPPNDPWSEKFRATSKTYQDKALGLLARELSTLHSSPVLRVGSDASTTLILGSVIILCNNELLTAQTAGWRVHLQAAREVIRAEADRLQLQQNTNRIQKFFLQEFYATSVWAQLTTFHEMDDMIVQSPLVSSRDAVFTDFLRIIHQITLAERVKARSQLLRIPQPDPIRNIDTHIQLELAKRSTICLSQTIQFWSETDRRNFEHLMWMYLHATLIYSYQALADPTFDILIQQSRDAILTHLHSLSGNEMFIQDLVWPLFIAGTELRGSRAGQKFIERQLTAVMRISRTLDRGRVLSFLKNWWTLPDYQYKNWIELARKHPSAWDFFIA